MVAASVIQAIIVIFVFVQASQMVMSVLNTRFDPCAQLMLRARYGLFESFRRSAMRGLFLPRLETVTRALTLLLGANTP